MWYVPTSWSEDTCPYFKRESLFTVNKTEDAYKASAIFREITGHRYQITGYGPSRKAAKDDCRRRARSSYNYVPFFGIIAPNSKIINDFVEVA